MDITIEPRLKRFVSRKLRSGEFKTPSDVVNFALDALEDADKDRRWLAEAIDKGLASLDRGEGTPWNAEKTKAKLLRRIGRRQRSGR